MHLIIAVACDVYKLVNSDSRITGARIFTIPEINSMHALGHIPQDAEEITEVDQPPQSRPRSPTQFSVKSFEGESEGMATTPRQNQVLDYQQQVAPASVLQQLRVSLVVSNNYVAL